MEKEEARVVAIDKRKQQEKVVTRIEDELKDATTKMNGLKLKTNILVGVMFFFLYRMVAAKWTGVVVARLPFMPIRIVQNLSHRGIEGNDVYECSFGLIYTLCTMGLKQNIPKLLGFVPPRSAYGAMRAADRAAKDTAKTS